VISSLKEREKSQQLEMESINKSILSFIDEMAELNNRVSHLRQENESAKKHSSMLQEEVDMLKNENACLNEQYQKRLEEEVQRLRNELTGKDGINSVEKKTRISSKQSWKRRQGGNGRVF
jgi:predicted nuclease with TOPRIM domain